MLTGTHKLRYQVPKPDSGYQSKEREIQIKSAENDNNFKEEFKTYLGHATHLQQILIESGLGGNKGSKQEKAS